MHCLHLVVVILNDGHPQYWPVVGFRGVDDPEGVGVAGSGLPAGHDDDEVSVPDEVPILAKSDGLVDPFIHVIGPRLHTGFYIQGKA